MSELNRSEVLTIVAEALAEKREDGTVNEVQHYVNQLTATVIHSLFADKPFVTNLARNLSVVGLNAFTREIEALGATAPVAAIVKRPIPGSSRISYSETKDEDGKPVAKLNVMERAVSFDDNGVPTEWEAIDISADEAGAVLAMMVSEGLAPDDYFYLTTDHDIRKQQDIVTRALQEKAETAQQQ